MIKVGFSDVAELQGCLLQRQALVMGMLSDGTGLLVTDARGQGGDQHQGAIDEPLNLLPIRLQALHQVLAEAGHGVLEHPDRLQQVEADQGLVDIHLQMPSCAGSGHGAIESDHLGADHGHGLALGGIDFPRHDRAAGFIGGQPQLP